ncbi:MAG: peptidase M28, partial [Sandarakinorhabdus sp.]|nr:peptidase M28 [Sandarakinorhabdus sp.]
MMRTTLLIAALLATTAAAPAPVSEAELKNTITNLVGFGTRHTLSDTVSETR